MKSMITLVRLDLLTVAFLALGLPVVAQEAKVSEKNVPAAVITAFKSAYPNATVRGYAREKENGKVFYEVESIEGNTHRDILYNADGSLEEVEETIAPADLPADAQQAIAKRFPRAVIVKAEKITHGDKTEYEVSARQGKRRISMEFDSDGRVTKSNPK